MRQFSRSETHGCATVYGDFDEHRTTVSRVWKAYSAKFMVRFYSEAVNGATGDVPKTNRTITNTTAKKADWRSTL